MRSTIFAVLIVLLLATPAGATGTIGAWTTHRVLQSPVEQESPNYFFNNCGGQPNNPACDPSTWVVNPTLCAWDSDDYDSDFSSGTLDGVATDTKCVIADGANNFGGDDKHVQVSVTAKVASLSVTLDDTRGHHWVAPAVRAGSTYTYIICTQETDAGLFGVIPDSNGGTGLVISYTVTIDSGAHKANGMSAVFQAFSTQGYFAVTCP